MVIIIPWADQLLGFFYFYLFFIYQICRLHCCLCNSSDPFGKVNSLKCKLKFTILQVDSAIGFTNLIGIMNHIYYRRKPFNLILQLFSLHVSWFGTHIHNFTKEPINCMTLFHREQCIMCKIFLIAPHNELYQIFNVW